MALLWTATKWLVTTVIVIYVRTIHDSLEYTIRAITVDHPNAHLWSGNPYRFCSLPCRVAHFSSVSPRLILELERKGLLHLSTNGWLYRARPPRNYKLHSVGVMESNGQCSLTQARSTSGASGWKASRLQVKRWSAWRLPLHECIVWKVRR